jgi:hypothetical protein
MWIATDIKYFRWTLRQFAVAILTIVKHAIVRIDAGGKRIEIAESEENTRTPHPLATIFLQSGIENAHVEPE